MEQSMTTLSIAPVSAIIARYKLWSSLPTDERPQAIQSKKDFAAYYGVSLSTLRQWEADPKFWEDTFAMAKNILGNRLAEVLTALGNRASSGNIPAVKLFLEVLGVHHDKIEHTVDFDDDRLVVIMPAGMALPEHLQHSTKQPLQLEDNSLMYEMVDQPVMEKAAVTAITRSDLDINELKPRRIPRGHRMVQENQWYKENPEMSQERDEED